MSIFSSYEKSSCKRTSYTPIELKELFEKNIWHPRFSAGHPMTNLRKNTNILINKQKWKKSIARCAQFSTTLTNMRQLIIFLPSKFLVKNFSPLFCDYICASTRRRGREI
jgi:hypothetical protein